MLLETLQVDSCAAQVVWYLSKDLFGILLHKDILLCLIQPKARHFKIILLCTFFMQKWIEKDHRHFRSNNSQVFRWANLADFAFLKNIYQHFVLEFTSLISMASWLLCK